MRWIHIIWLLVFFALSGHVRAERLVLAVSEDDIAVTANFTGAGIALLGSIERDAQTVARRAGYDVIVALQGPPETLVTRRSARLGGIWVNRDTIRHINVPSLYLMTANRPLPLIANDRVLDKLKLGLRSLHFKTLEQPSQRDEIAFREAAIRLKTKEGLYGETADGVKMITKTLFRARISLPANIRTGRYEATVYLFGDGAFLGQETTAFYVGKTGFEATLSRMARTEPLLYGLLAVAVAMLTGWLGGVIFRRD